MDRPRRGLGLVSAPDNSTRRANRSGSNCASAAVTSSRWSSAAAARVLDRLRDHRAGGPGADRPPVENPCRRWACTRPRSCASSSTITATKTRMTLSDSPYPPEAPRPRRSRLVSPPSTSSRRLSPCSRRHFAGGQRDGRTRVRVPNMAERAVSISLAGVRRSRTPWSADRRRGRLLSDHEQQEVAPGVSRVGGDDSRSLGVELAQCRAEARDIDDSVEKLLFGRLFDRGHLAVGHSGGRG